MELKGPEALMWFDFSSFLEASFHTLTKWDGRSHNGKPAGGQRTGCS